LGIGGQVELGVDRCFGGETGTFGNLKVLLVSEDDSRPAIAVGVQGLAEGAKSETYVALAKDVSPVRLHLGAIRLGGEKEAMAGLEYGLGDRAVLMLDHVTGTGDVSGVGVGVDLTEALALTVSRILSHETGGDDVWQVILSAGTTIDL
jgi:hypothetical protein